jgi:predicted transcriptional regulator
MIHQNSKEAFAALINSGDLGRQESKVLRYIYENEGLTRHEISRGVNLPLSSVCGRVSGLKDRNVVHEKGIKNKRSTLYFGADPEADNLDEVKAAEVVEKLIGRVRSLVAKFPQLEKIATL